MTVPRRLPRPCQRALLLYPSQIFCADPNTYPVVVRTQLVKLYSFLRAQGVADVRILDLELEIGRPIDDDDLSRFLDRAAELIGHEPYDLIGISCYTSVSYTATLEIVNVLRRIQPDAVVAVGGYHCLASAEDFEGCAGIDHVVRGDGIGFLEALLRGDDIAHFASFNGPSLAFGRMLYDEYPYRYRRLPAVAHVQLSRGCPFQCAFCCEPFLGNSQYRPLEVDAALAEIDEAIRVFQPDKVIIEDLLFGFHAPWRYAFLEALRDRKYEQIFWVEMRSDTITERTAELMSEQNIDLTIGLESAARATIAHMAKAKDPDAYIRSFHRTAGIVQAAGVPTTFTVMLNYPGETLDSFHETMDHVDTILARQTTPVFRFDFLEYSFYPGNQAYTRIADLETVLGTEIGDRRWYARRDGRMLEEALCSVPSRDLAVAVGRDGVRTYFRDRAARVDQRVQQTGHLRSRLMWSYRFIKRLQRRCPSIAGHNLFARQLSPDTQRVAVVADALADVHRRVMARVSSEQRTTQPESWPQRMTAWERAFEWVCERVPDDCLPTPAALAAVRDEIEMAGTAATGWLSSLNAPRSDEASRPFAALV